MNRSLVYWLTCVFLMVGLVSQATTIVMPEDEQLIAKAPLIVEATVESVTPIDMQGAIWTETTVSVNSRLKGEAAGTLTIREPGGEIDDRITKIFGAPEFTVGEQVLLFLSPDPRSEGYRVVDLFVGKFKAGETTNGRRMWLRNDGDHDVNLLDKDLHHVHPRNVQRDAIGFERFVRDRIAGRAGIKNYGVENPVLRTSRSVQSNLDSSSTSPSISSEFTLISEPTVYRWFHFDNGTSAPWRHAGSQPGYSDGGVSELRTGMAAWTSYSSAKIYYTYAGGHTGTLGGMSKRNNVNEVLFNDPLNEIEGTWKSSSGGVVGIGGFNGVATGGMWTAPFTADAKHPAGSVRAYEIVEANLVIQDGVSPGNGISSNRLAEILAHEFGHTLGFGHSASNSALMYATVTGIGPSLRDDDKLAARWLYPNGSSSEPAPSVPAAPSNLTATPSGNNLDLKWTDNASNEASQSIHLAVGTGAFSKVAQVGANVTSTRLSGLAAGSYRVYVVASNSNGSSSPSNTASATIASVPVAAFTFTPQSGTTGVTNFTFYDQSSGTVTSRQWNFGDGTTSTAAIASHVYAKSGNYTVTLTVTGNGGSSSTSRSVSVSATLSASFAFSPASPSTSEVVRFTDQSAGAPTSWRWAFSDGSVITQQNPSKQFPTAGTHAVTLTVYRGSESSSMTRQVSVQGSSAVPFRTLVSVAAQTGGQSGTTWRTELSLFNAGSQGANVTLTYVPSAGSTIQTRNLFLSPAQSVTYANTLHDLFSIANGAGAIGIEATSAGTSADLRVSSRTFTTGGWGTYGQSVPDVQNPALQQTLYVTGIQSNAAFRTNIGLVNRAANAVGATLTLHASNGAVLATNNLTLGANSFQQSPLATYFPIVSGRSYDVLTMRMSVTHSNSVSAYASVVDNVSQDPIFVQAVPASTGGSLTIPVVGRAPGGNNTFWRSDVTLHNPGSTVVTLTLRYAGMAKSVTLQARQTTVLSDILMTFGKSSGSGAMEVTWSGSSGPVATTRTYTTASGGGSFGQSIDPIPGFARQMFVIGLRNDGNYRSNVGFVNGGTATKTFAVAVLSPWGSELARTYVTLAPKAQIQYTLGGLFPGLSSSIGSFTLKAEGDSSATIFAYGSMVDNKSGDPVFFAGR